MKAQHVYGLIRIALILFVVFIVGSTLWSVKNVVDYFWKDGMRVVVISAAIVGSVALYWQHAHNAVQKRDRTYLVVVGIVAALVLVMSLAFVFLDYTINLFGTFDSLDQRLKTSVSVAVWITSVILLVCSFGLAVFYKHTYPKEEMPIQIIVLELVATFFCIWANAWGTSDAVYRLTQDHFSAIAMAITIDFMIFLMGAWYLIANDSSTSSITLWTTFVGIGMTTVLQITDGFLSGANFTATEEVKNIAQFAFPAILFLSAGLIVTTFFVDYFKGGLSIVKPNTRGEFDEPSHNPTERPTRPERFEQRIGHGQGYRPQSPRGLNPPTGGKDVQRPPQGKGTSKFAEPGGLEQETVAALKSLGYSNRAIEGMRQVEADNRIKNNVPPRPDQMSGNHPDFGKKKGETKTSDNSAQRVATHTQMPSPADVRQLYSKNGNGDDEPNF